MKQMQINYHSTWHSNLYKLDVGTLSLPVGMLRVSHSTYSNEILLLLSFMYCVGILKTSSSTGISVTDFFESNRPPLPQ